MRSPFTFEGRIGQLPYALWSVGLYFTQHVAVFALSGGRVRPRGLDWWFYLAPLRSLVMLDQPSNIVLLVALAYTLIVAWALAALAFCRAADANISDSLAVFVVVPTIQIAAIVALCCFSSRQPAGSSAAERLEPTEDGWAAAVQGVVAGIALTLLVVVASALLFGVYGFGLFVLSPLVIGATTAYLANRKRDLGGSRTVSLVLAATALGGLALVTMALEGIICIVLAAPLGFGAALIGGMLGRAAALAGRRSATQTLSGFALLPVVFAFEHLIGTATTFEIQQTVTIAAPPAAVWQSIVHMDTIEAPPTLPFRLGIAYPLRSEVMGEGVGALRHGAFSTGTTLGRVTEWITEHKLTFEVINDVPAMRELSPYEHVHAPHAVGYFRTNVTSFELVPRPDGGTDLIERTSHELRLEPVAYWLPMARWVVDANNARVLAHIRSQAERNVSAGAGMPAR